MGVQKFSEAVEELTTLQASTLGVNKHQQGADVWVQSLVLQEKK